MRKVLESTFLWIIGIFGLIGILSFFLVIYNDAYFKNLNFIIDTKLASQFGDFFGGFVGTIFSIISVFLLIYTIYKQNYNSKKIEVETNFFRMIDYHNQNVNQLKIPNVFKSKKDKISEGRRGFVEFKIQFHYLLEIIKKIDGAENYNLRDTEIVDIAYIVFYYGLEGSWISFIEKKLAKYEDSKSITFSISQEIIKQSEKNLKRTNQTNLSTYFRNMFNAIKMIDESRYLRQREKINLIKIYRAQLSNPELYILFFNVLSRFGKKWISNNYIEKYELFKNIPHNYCDDYEPKMFFKGNYEEDYY